MLKASLGSVEFITSLRNSEDESRKIKEAVNASSYGSDFVHAALSVDEKVRLLNWFIHERYHLTCFNPNFKSPRIL